MQQRLVNDLSETYPNEADNNSKWHQNEITNEKSNEPYDTKTPRYEFMISVRSCQ